MTKLSLTVLVAALLVSSPALSSGRNAHASTAIAIDSGRFVVTQSRSHPQSRLAREAYIKTEQRQSRVPINQPGRHSFIPVSVEQGANPTNRFFRQDAAREEILILFKEQR